MKRTKESVLNQLNLGEINTKASFYICPVVIYEGKEECYTFAHYIKNGNV